MYSRYPKTSTKISLNGGNSIVSFIEVPLYTLKNYTLLMVSKIIFQWLFLRYIPIIGDRI